MVLRWTEGFDDGLHNIRAICTATPSSAYGRHGNGVYLGDDVSGQYLVRSAIGIVGSTVIYGCGMNLREVSPSPTLVISGTNMPALTLLGGTDLTGVQVTVNSNTVATASGDVPAGWNFVEVKVLYSATVGTIEIRVNGATKASGTALNTGTAPTAVTPQIAGIGSYDIDRMYADDFYLCDGSGSFNNDFLGDIEVVPLLPNGNGNSSVMVGSDGNSTDNHLLVDDNPVNATDYVGSDTEGDKDTYAMDDLSGTPTVLAVVSSVYAVKSDTGTKYMRPIFRSGSTDYLGTSVALSTAHIVLEEIYDYDPDTAAAWLYGGVNSAEVGQEVRDS